ncbi:MAG: bifunctional oligoribonuclease/PAP phosphatase NrnA [Chloroflexi bacterium]|nr:bifunctional oligoribonuclease/PAP phosphatase NrnA [Chloroflexota bacterium]
MLPAEANWQAAADAIADAQTVLVASHVSPDGDAIGSLLGIAGALRGLSKIVTAAIDEGVPDELAFLPNSQTILPKVTRGEFDLMIALDASDIERIGSVGKYGLAHSRRVINLDHHPTNTRFGDILLVMPEAVAAAEVVFDLLQYAGWQLSRDVAFNLLAGLVTDTQGFRIPATSSRCLEIAQALMEAGAPLSEIMARTLNRRSFAEVTLWQNALQSVQLQDGLISAAITQSDLEQASLHKMTDGGLVNYLVDVDAAKVAVVFKELPTAVEISFRAKPGYDVGRLALALGGGGHVLAAGCTLAGSLQQAQELVLALTRKTIDAGEGG